MPEPTGSKIHRLFSFSVPGLPDVTLAIPAVSVITVLRRATIRPLPVTPPAVLGVHDWSGEMLPVLDLARLLTDTPLAPRPVETQLLASSLPGPDNNPLIAAWPLNPGSRIQIVSSLLSQAERAEGLHPDLIFDAVMFEREPLHLLHLARFTDVLTNASLPAS